MTVTVKLAQLYLTLGDPMNYTAYGILQARILEWVAYPFSSKHEHLIKVMNGLRVLPRLFLVA